MITVAGRRALESADVVLYDALVNAALLDHAPASAERVFVGKRAAQHALPQADIEALLVCHAQEGKRVVRLKGGDPFVFGRGSEEAQACRTARIPFTVVPGISSSLGGPAYAGIPVTHRGLAGNVLVMTASAGGDDGASAPNWDTAALAETVVILMGAGTLAADMERLMAAGKAPKTPVACVQWATRHDQQVVTGTVATIAQRAKAVGLGSPLATVIGPVAALADEIAWFAPGPLAGKRVAVTRAEQQVLSLAERLESAGAQVVRVPAIITRTTGEDLVTDERVASRWDWVLFTSANGVESFFELLERAGRDARALGGTHVAAVGEATAAALRAHAIVPDFVPSRATGADLADEVPRVDGARVLLPVSALTDHRTADRLRARGAHVEQVAVYETVPGLLTGWQVREVVECDAIAFSSASTARYLRAALGEEALPERVKLVSIGPQTSAALQEEFGRVDREAGDPSLDGLVAAVTEALAWD